MGLGKVGLGYDQRTETIFDVISNKTFSQSLNDLGDWLDERQSKAEERGMRDAYWHMKQYITLSIRKSKSKDAILKFLNKQIKRCKDDQN